MPTGARRPTGAKRVLARAREVLRIEAQAVTAVGRQLSESFAKAVEAILRCKGRVVVTGMGKHGLIGRKIAATFASTGTPALFMHPAEAIHGDLGMVGARDIVLILSNSGRTDEILKLLGTLQRIGCRRIAITGDRRSPLARACDIVLNAAVRREACSLNLAPTASTTAALALGDALAICVYEGRGFRPEDFARFHPGGQLGKRLTLRVSDCMRDLARCAAVGPQTPLKDALLAMTRVRSGCALVTNGTGRLVGIFTDGDLRRRLEKDAGVVHRPIGEVMTRRPSVTTPDELAVVAMQRIEDKKIDELPVIDRRGRPVGLLDVQDLVKAGLV